MQCCSDALLVLVRDGIFPLRVFVLVFVNKLEVLREDFRKAGRKAKSNNLSGVGLVGRDLDRRVCFAFAWGADMRLVDTNIAVLIH